MYGNATPFTEGTDELLLVTGTSLPGGEATFDMVLVPKPFEGYSSRLYFSRVLPSAATRNWNGNRSFLERNWRAFSWQGVEVAGKRLIQLIQQHLQGLSGK